MTVYLLAWYVRYMAPKPLPPRGPSPTPLTAYLAKHPETNMMRVALACGLHYDTVHAAETGVGVPSVVTLFKLEDVLGIPVQAWRACKAVQIRMERRSDPGVYREKAERWRKKKLASNPEAKQRDDARRARYEARRKARRNGEEVPPVPMSNVKARLLGLPEGTLEGMA